MSLYSILYLSSNNLTGNIPDFSNNINLTHLCLSDNKLSGNIPDFSRNHALAKLNISYNKLSGNLPSFINNRALYLLHLSKNYDFNYNCPGGKDIISPEQITNLISCKLGKIILSKGCNFSNMVFDKCDVHTVLSNAKSIYYISIVQIIYKK
ncbi:uncharacterized protein LOC126329623 [Schistocerca gregaria]|uniref:uncharacterized protein LOC126329623 n=1 Tax=Schistocerca gregaria TaxID=7010 RepID=UPI00211F3D16|nr:uncharacterized protein LOC126329623 [Schistocerca gregaria]